MGNALSANDNTANKDPIAKRDNAILAMKSKRDQVKQFIKRKENSLKIEELKRDNQEQVQQSLEKTRNQLNILCQFLVELNKKIEILTEISDFSELQTLNKTEIGNMIEEVGEKSDQQQTISNLDLEALKKELRNIFIFSALPEAARNKKDQKWIDILINAVISKEAIYIILSLCSVYFFSKHSKLY